MAAMTTHEPFTSPSSRRWRYDVFLSFRGIDTRNNFTGHLYERLKEAGIKAFIDDSELRSRGTFITEELTKAIEASKISVVVFSRRYGDSRWCLDELVEIMGCRKRLGQTVLPIFYDVDPTDVRKQTGSFGETFDQKHQHKDPTKVESWRDALTEAGNLSGWDLRAIADGNEPKVIKMIVEQIIGELPSTYLLSVARHPVGMNARLQDLTHRLRVESRDDVCMIGILGMGGIGKTTLAKAIYNKFYQDFQGKVSFLENVRETTKQQNGLVGLQNQLLADILKPTKLEVGIVDRGKEVIKQRLQYMRVLVIIDDVDDEDQLNALAGNSDWFGSGSRILITTRDADMLKRVVEDSIYRVQPLHEVESFELFCWHAFRNSSYPKEGYHELSKRAVSYCAGLPLALKVIGSFLFGKDTHEWESHLEKLKRIPDDQIVQKLKLCYDGLSDRHREKDIFLDIACFFIGMDKNYVTTILDGCDFFAAIGIRVLLDRCLVTLSKSNELMIHDLLQDMGRDVVCEKYRDEPEKRSRLWHSTDVEEVLTETSATEGIEGLSTLNLPNSDVKSFSTEAFTNMKRLRLLRLNHVNVAGNYKYLSKKKLRWLCWHGFPLVVIPREFDLQSLFVIDLSYSKLTQVWDDPQYFLENLKILNLSHSHDLMHSPDFSRLPNLEQLILKDCKSLCEVHQSIGTLQRLSLVNLADCKMLKCLPNSFRKLKLETLDLSGTNLAGSLLEMVGSTTSLADETAIRYIPIRSSLSYALRELSLGDCNLTDDSKLVTLRGLSLDYLDLTRNRFRSLKNLSGVKVKMLILDECENLRAIAALPTNLNYLSLIHCTSLETIPKFSHEFSPHHIEMSNCPELNDCPGLVDWVKMGAVIDISGHIYDIPSPLKTAILKEWRLIQGTGISFRGNKIPWWCSHVNSRGRTVSFEMPRGSEKAFFVCLVYSSPISKSEFQYQGGLVLVNHTKRTGFYLYHWPGCYGDSNKKYISLRNMLLQDRLCLEGCDLIEIGAVNEDCFKVHQIGVELIQDFMPFDCDAGLHLKKSIPYEEALDFLADDDTDGSAGATDDTDNSINEDTDESVDDDTDESVDEAGASSNLFDADNGIVGDYGEDDEGGARHDPVDEDRPIKRLRSFDPSIVTVSTHEVAFTPSPSRAHFDPTQIASSSKGGQPQCMGMQALYHQQQMLILQLQSENRELRRQLILSQQPNQIVSARSSDDDSRT